MVAIDYYPFCKAIIPLFGCWVTWMRQACLFSVVLGLTRTRWFLVLFVSSTGLLERGLSGLLCRPSEFRRCWSFSFPVYISGNPGSTTRRRSTSLPALPPRRPLFWTSPPHHPYLLRDGPPHHTQFWTEKPRGRNLEPKWWIGLFLY